MSQTSRSEVQPTKKPPKSSLAKLEYNRKRYWTQRDKLLAQHKEYYRRNREVLLQKSKEYVEANKEKTKEYKRGWHQKNRERVIVKATKWNRENLVRRKEILAKYRNENREKIREHNKKVRTRYRKLVIEHYSGGANKCECCGEATFEFLTIDHINSDGNIHRKSINLRGGHHFYHWLIKNNYPSGFQVLCSNCNIAKHIHGTCPHQNTNTPL